MKKYGHPDMLKGLLASEHGTPLSPPLTRSSTFEYPDRASHNRAIEGSDRFYARNGHEIGRLVEARMAELEGAEGALLFASGIAAVTALLLGLSKSGSRLAISRFSYGGTLALCKQVLPDFGIEVDCFDPFDAQDLDRAFAAKPDLVQVETPINPTLRLREQSAHAMDLAHFLHEHRERLRIEAVHYPGLPSHPDHELAKRSLHNFGSMLSLQLRGGLERAVRAFDALTIFHRGPSLGGSESLVCLPAETSHAMLSEAELREIGFDPGLLRFSVGIEPLDLLMQDLEQALQS